MIDLDLKYEERVNFEKCLTENYLMKHGMDYFGKRDLIYIDLYGKNDVRRLTTTSIDAEWNQNDTNNTIFKPLSVKTNE